MPVKTEDEACRNFASNVRYLIARSGKQQQEVAADLGLSATAFNNYMMGRNLPKFTVMQSIADYFHVNLEDLVRPLVGGSVMFNMQLTAEELDLVEAFRKASPSQRSMALADLREIPVGLAALRPEMDQAIVPTRDAIEDFIDRDSAEDLLKKIDEAVARAKSGTSGLERYRELQRQRAAQYAALVASKKEGAE